MALRDLQYYTRICLLYQIKLTYYHLDSNRSGRTNERKIDCDKLDKESICTRTANTVTVKTMNIFRLRVPWVGFKN